MQNVNWETRDVAQLSSNRVVLTGTLIWPELIKEHGWNQNSVIFGVIECQVYLLNNMNQTDLTGHISTKSVEYNLHK